LRAQLDADKLLTFIRGQIDDDLTSVPGVGPKGAEKLRENGIKTTTALVGRFLVCKTAAAMSAQDLADAFYEYLREIGIDSHRASVVRCIGGKANAMIPGIFREGDLA
jgi:Holliday junction resolvasome RuvABC DNA-binding subunit